jgi:demethylmenaquinone methyltransferase/2-methoxy-6-polyprenyl-1,4-benzoquinol methylase
MPHDVHQAFYDQLAAEWDLRFTAEDLERLGNLVDTFGVEEGWNVLDLGCGTGILFDMLRRRVGPTGTVTGVDFSIRMAEQAHRNFPFPNVNVVDADASNLPFRDSLFDMAVAFSAFPHFTHQRRALREAHRVLKTGAKFCIIHLASSKEIAEKHHRVGGVIEHDQMPPGERMREMFEESQFDPLEVDDHPGLYYACAVNIK